MTKDIFLILLLTAAIALAQATAPATAPATLPASRPALLSVHLKDATAKQAIAALNRVAPVELRLADDEEPAGTLTLDLDNQPFWLVIDEVCRKFRLAPSESNAPGLMLLEHDGGSFSRKPRVMCGQTLVVVDYLSHDQSVHASGADREESFTATLTALTDPTRRVTWYEPQVTLERAVDDRGNSLVPVKPDAPDEAAAEELDAEASAFCLSLTVPLRHPQDKAGQRIAMLRGSFEHQTLARTESWSVPNPLQIKDAAKALHKGRCIVHRVRKTSDKEYTVDLVIHRDTASDAQWQLLRLAGASGLFRLHDAAGKPLYKQDSTIDAHARRISITLQFSRDDPAGQQNVGVPVTITWELPLELSRQRVEFEFKDLPLP